MIFLILLILLLILAEIFLSPRFLQQLHFESTVDSVLAAPGEKMVLHTRVENRGRMPLPFVRLRLLFPSEARYLGKKTTKQGIKSWYLEEKLSLRGLQSRESDLHFSLHQRGLHRVGQCRIAAGDVLGFEEKAMELEGQSIVVMPELCSNPQKLQTLGGFLGAYSVNRFQMEDPMLTVGFRDYSGAEPLKDISWKRTAVSGSLQVKQYDRTAEQIVTVLLDVEGGKPKELEQCFSLTRTVCEELERKKIPYALRTNGSLTGPTGRFFVLPEGLGQAHRNAICYGLGRADYLCFFSAHRLCREAMEHRREGCSHIVISAKEPLEARQCFRSLETLGSLCVLSGKEEA